MRVLIHNRDPKLWLGGDMVQLNNTMKALTELGIDVDFSHDPNTDLTQYDLVHVFHINFGFVREMYERLIKENKRYVISAIFYRQVYDVPLIDMRRYAENAEKIICLSLKEKLEMQEMLGIDGKKIVVISNGVDKDIFRPMKMKKKNRIIAVGRLEPMKGPQFVIQAALRLKLPLCYVGQGKGDLADTMKQYIDEYVPECTQGELAKLMNQSSVYVCSSLTERQSLGVLEAAACGLPIVDSIHNRGSSLLPSSVVVNPENINELCTAILKQMGERNRDFVPSWEDVASEVLKVYADVI